MAIADFASNETAPTVRTHLNEIVTRVNTLSNGVATLADADADTRIRVEQTADDDTVRVAAAGVEVLTLTSNTAVWGTASNQTFTMVGRWICREVSNANLNANIAGSTAEIVFNSNDKKFYGCTNGGAAGAALWVAFH